MAHNPFAPDVVWTGADDCTLKGWDLRSGCGSASFSNRKAHQMGVTAIQFSALSEHLAATGSYDESLRLWDARQTRRPLSELAVGGGIWRIKWHPTDAGRVVVAAMHGGVATVDVSGAAPSSASGADDQQELAACALDEASRFELHESMAYGVDWVGEDSVASCSFYDHDVRVYSR